MGLRGLLQAVLIVSTAFVTQMPASARQGDSEPMSAKELARWYVEDVLNGGRTEALKQRLSDTFTLHVPPSLADGPVVQGPDAFAGLVAALRKTFPDIRFTIGHLVADQHVAMVSFTMEGTHRDTWLGVPATAKRIRMTGVDVIRVADGRIEQIRIHGDYLGALQQLGAIPKP